MRDPLKIGLRLSLRISTQRQPRRGRDTNADISGDKQTIQVSGIVRPSDISYNNTIRSEQVANFQLVSDSNGPSKDYNTPGWLSKFMGGCGRSE